MKRVESVSNLESDYEAGLRVAVTGCAGHFGSKLVNRLLSDGVEVVGFDVLRYGGEGMLGFLSHPAFRFEKLDLSESTSDVFAGLDVVVHLAAMVGPVCDKFPEEAWETNLGITERICEQAKENGVKVLLASTCSNYGVLAGVADENSPLNPLGVYALTKVASEDTISAMEDQGLVFRFATLAGLSLRPRFDTLLNQWCYESLKNGVIDCFRPQARRPFVHVSDAVSAVVTAINSWDSLAHRCYNVVGFNTTKGDLAEEVAAVAGCKVTYTSAEDDPRDYSVSGELLQNETGFSPQYSLRDCVYEVYSALRQGLITPREAHYNL
jgi:nucleoside-diphosphate-sugar epimerase